AAVTLTRFERERILSKPTGSLSAYDHVLRGREYFSHATRNGNDEAQDMLLCAIDLDPSYAAAYAALGLSLVEAVASGWTEFPGDALSRAEALADRALEINPYDAESFATRGAVLVWGGRAAEALVWFEGALRVDRANARTAFLHGMAYYFVDRHAEAVEAMDRGLAGNL